MKTLILPISLFLLTIIVFSPTKDAFVLASRRTTDFTDWADPGENDVLASFWATTNGEWWMMDEGGSSSSSEVYHFREGQYASVNDVEESVNSFSGFHTEVEADWDLFDSLIPGNVKAEIHIERNTGFSLKLGRGLSFGNTQFSGSVEMRVPSFRRAPSISGQAVLHTRTRNGYIVQVPLHSLLKEFTKQGEGIFKQTLKYANRVKRNARRINWRSVAICTALDIVKIGGPMLVYELLVED